MELGVRLAFFLDDRQLRAEAEEGQGAVEGRELESLREILAFPGAQGEIGPVGPVEAAGDGGRGTHREAQRQRVGCRETAPGSRGAMRAQARLLLGITGGQADGQRRSGLPASFQREGPAGTVQEFGMLVSPLVPARPFDGQPLRAEPLRALEAQAVFHEHGLIGRPLLSPAGQQAGLRVASDDPTRSDVQRDLHAIEGRSLMLLSPEVGPGAQLEALRQGMLVLGATPDDEAHPGGGFGLVGHREGQAVEKDDFLGRGGVDVAVRRQREAEVRVPAAPGADGVEVAPHVFHYGIRRFAGQHAFEMLPGQFVLLLEKEGSSQFEARSAQIGLENQNASQSGDGRVQQGFPGFVFETRRAGSADASQSCLEKEVYIVGIGRQEGLEKLKRFEVASFADKFFGIFDAGLQRSRHQQKNGEYRQQTRHD